MGASNPLKLSFALGAELDRGICRESDGSSLGSEEAVLLDVVGGAPPCCVSGG